MKRLINLLCICCLLHVGNSVAADTVHMPMNVVSLDYCADQFVLKLLPRSRILAVSPDADESFSYMRDRAEGLHQVRPIAEDILLLQPDLVVRSYGGGPGATSFFERANIPVLQVPYAQDLEGISRATLEIARRMGQLELGQEIVTDMSERLQAIDLPTESRRVLYMTSGGATSGPGTLVHEMLSAAGLTNYEDRRGWHSIPLERLAYDRPDVVVAVYFDEGIDRAALWSAMRHPVARRQMRDLPTVLLEGAWTSCGGWFLVDAIEAIATARTDAQ